MNAQDTNSIYRVAVMMGVFVARRSGGHLNPAVTFANCIYRGFPWYKLPYYTVAQVLGAMLGAVVVYANYVSAIDLLEGAPGVRTINATAGVFATYPVPFISTRQQFFSEFLASAILMFSIFSLVDAGLGSIMPLFLLFLIFGIGASFGWETGYAMNLARDFGPRLMCFFVGYGDAVFTASGSYFWVCLSPFTSSTRSDRSANRLFRSDPHRRAIFRNGERRSPVRRARTRRRQQSYPYAVEQPIRARVTTPSTKKGPRIS